jgi:3-phenylpropionate/cinnamic acid dioxygenase small subunit
VTTLEDRQEITDVLVRYATGIDTKDWPLFRTVFTPDAVCDYGAFGHWTDIDGVTEFMIAAHERCASTRHCLSNFVIDVQGDQASATSYVQAVLAFDDVNEAWIDAVGAYQDTLVRTADGWRISARTVQMTRQITNGVIPTG